MPNAAENMALPAERARVPQWTLGERMGKARRLAGYTQAQMAALLEVSAPTVSSWETAVRQPQHQFDMLRRWAELTNVDYRWLVTGEDGTIVTYDDNDLVIVDEGQLRLPIELPHSKRIPALTLV